MLEEVDQKPVDTKEEKISPEQYYTLLNGYNKLKEVVVNLSLENYELQSANAWLKNQINKMKEGNE